MRNWQQLELSADSSCCFADCGRMCLGQRNFSRLLPLCLCVFARACLSDGHSDNSKTFTLEDVFNNTLKPKGFGMRWISGELDRQLSKWQVMLYNLPGGYWFTRDVTPPLPPPPYVRDRTWIWLVHPRRLWRLSARWRVWACRNRLDADHLDLVSSLVLILEVHSRKTSRVKWKTKVGSQLDDT